jgi:hypothetical protein
MPAMRVATAPSLVNSQNDASALEPSGGMPPASDRKMGLHSVRWPQRVAIGGGPLVPGRGPQALVGSWLQRLDAAAAAGLAPRTLPAANMGTAAWPSAWRSVFVPSQGGVLPALLPDEPALEAAWQPPSSEVLSAFRQFASQQPQALAGLDAAQLAFLRGALVLLLQSLQRRELPVAQLPAALQMIAAAARAHGQATPATPVRATSAVDRPERFQQPASLPEGKAAEALQGTPLLGPDGQWSNRAPQLLEAARDELALLLDCPADVLSNEAVALKAAELYWTGQAERPNALARARHAQETLTALTAPLRGQQRERQDVVRLERRFDHTLRQIQALKRGFDPANIERTEIDGRTLAQRRDSMSPLEWARQRLALAERYLDHYQAQATQQRHRPEVQQFLQRAGLQTTQWRSALGDSTSLKSLIANALQHNPQLTVDQMQDIVDDNTPVIRPRRFDPARRWLRENEPYELVFRGREDLIRELEAAWGQFRNSNMQLRYGGNRIDVSRNQGYDHAIHVGTGRTFVADPRTVADALLAFGNAESSGGVAVISYGSADSVMTDRPVFYMTAQQVREWQQKPEEQRLADRARQPASVNRALADRRTPTAEQHEPLQRYAGNAQEIALARELLPYTNDAAGWSSDHPLNLSRARQLLTSMGVPPESITNRDARRTLDNIRAHVSSLHNFTGDDAAALDAELDSRLASLAGYLHQRDEDVISRPLQFAPPRWAVALMLQQLEAQPGGSGFPEVQQWEQIEQLPRPQRDEVAALTYDAFHDKVADGFDNHPFEQRYVELQHTVRWLDDHRAVLPAGNQWPGLEDNTAFREAGGLLHHYFAKTRFQTGMLDFLKDLQRWHGEGDAEDPATFDMMNNMIDDRIADLAALRERVAGESGAPDPLGTRRAEHLLQRLKRLLPLPPGSDVPP